MAQVQFSPIAGLPPDILHKTGPDGISTEFMWEMLEDRATAVRTVRIGDVPYRLVGSEPLGQGVSLYLLGAQYERACHEREWSRELEAVLDRDSARGRFYLLVLRLPGRGGAPVPVMTFLEDHAGNWHLLEGAAEKNGGFWAILTFASHLLAERRSDPARLDDFGDFLTLGGPSIIQRHSTERLRKHIARKVLFDQRLCTHCLRCATACNEMRAVVTEKGARLLGPSEDYCTNCGLCQKRCSFLTAQSKEEMERTGGGRLRVDEVGPAIHLYGNHVGAYVSELEAFERSSASWFPYHIRSVLEPPADLESSLPIDRQILLDPQFPAPDSSDLKPLLVTLSTGPDSESRKALVRTACQAALVLQTRDGEVEMELARTALRLGLQVVAAASGDGESFAPPANDAGKLFHRLGSWRPDPLLELWDRRAVDLFLAPFPDRLPVELQQRLIEETGSERAILSPHIPQALRMGKSPLLKDMNRELARIFLERPELLDAEAKVATELLEDIPRNHALLHARYRSMALASGHTACPTCAEAQVLAIPVYMAIAMSLARREIPQVSFTCETGCMSETLNKVNEAAQKVPGGRTVFGGGFAFGEAVTMAEDRAVRMGYLKKGRRYVVSQGGDGGAVIGLPAWLNALRQQAFLIRQRYSNVLHFINITDTQVYSNTGGESSASSLLGMGTLTTPIGKFLIGNQKVQWNLIDLAAEFPGILVGAGHSANKAAMQEFWQLADRLGQSAIRWDVTPCPETGKFFGEDPDDLAEVMAHAGMIPEVVFVGRFRKRIAPFHPEDRNKPYREWRRQPKPILYWLHRDPRYKALLRKNALTGEPEPRDATAHFLMKQLENYRDQLNWQIDIETHLVRQAEEWVAALMQELQETWKRYRYRLDQFPYAMLFNRHGDWKPEYAVSLENEMVRRVLGWDELARYAAERDRSMQGQQDELEKTLARLEELEAVDDGSFQELKGRENLLRESLSRIQALSRELKEEIRELQDEMAAAVRPDPVEEEIFPTDTRKPSSLPEARREDLLRLLDRILEERGLARMTELQQHRLAQHLKRDFLRGGGLIREVHTVASAPEREEIRRKVASFGPFSVGVASLAGDRGIAINRIFAQFFTARGAWAGMAWQFGSSKRGTPVLSATFVNAVPLLRKDAMYSFPTAVLTVTNYGDMRHQPDLFFDQLHPRGILLINQRRPPELLWEELVSGYPEEIRSLVLRLRSGPTVTSGESAGGGLERSAADSVTMNDLFEEISRALWERPFSQLTGEQGRQARKVAAMACCTVIAVDMDGIMQEVSGSANVVSNLVAVGPMFEVLGELGFPLDWERDLQLLSQGFPPAVLKNKRLLDQYYKAMERARREMKRCSPGFRIDTDRADRAPSRDLQLRDDPGEYLMIMGGTLAGMVLSQIATAEHPLFYVGFPITPAGNPFYAMADAFANGHPYIVVDEVNPSEKVAAEKLLGIARTGGFLPVTFTASQGWRLFTEVIPQFVGARLEGIFLLARRALAAPNLNIEESHTDFMSFRDDGGIMLTPKSIQEYVPALYLARLLTHFAKIPVILSIGGITDTHKIGLVKVPPDDRVRRWLKDTLKGFDFLEHKLLNRQGDLIVHGPSGTSAVYQETQSEIEKAHQAAARIYPYAVGAVEELTGVSFDELEAAGNTPRESVETLFILQGSLYPNAVEALRELDEAGWQGMACLSLRCFNPFPEEKLFSWFKHAKRVAVLDRSNSFGSIPPLASRIFSALARYSSFSGDAVRKGLRTLVGGLGGREITVEEMKEILLSTHLLFHAPESWEPPLIGRWLEEGTLLHSLLHEAAALDLRNTDRHTRVPPHLRSDETREEEYRTHVARIKELLVAKNYAALLANYHQVEMIGPREVLKESALLQQIVLHLEIRLARHAISAGRATWRHALLLLHYSQDVADHQLAGPVVEKGIASGDISPRLGITCGVSAVSLPESGESAPESQPGVGFGALEGGVSEAREGEAKPAYLPVEFDPAEADRIAAVLSGLVELQGERPLFYNPEDFEHELIAALRKDPHASLHALQELYPSEAFDDVVEEYRHCYRDTIDRVLQREILGRHHAPELLELFEGEGLRRLEELAGRLEERLGDVPVEKKRKVVVEEVERYLVERCHSGYPKTPGFYLEYYRNWVAPQLRRR